MSSAAVAQLKFINQIPIDVVTRPGGSQALGHVYPELAGYKVRMTGQTPIHVIDRNGYRRLVPFPHTFMHLFKDAAVIQGTLVSDLVTEIAEGPSLDDGAILIRGMSSERIYLLDRGKKRLITSHIIMDKYDFNEDAVVVVPQILIDSVPTGDIWE